MSDEERGVEEGSDEAVVEEPEAVEPVEEPEAVEPVEEPEAVEPAEEDVAAEPVEQEPAIPEPEAPVVPTSDGFWATGAPAPDPEALKPARKQTGLIVVVASIVLVLLVCVFAGPALYKAIVGRSTPEVTSTAASKAKITVTIDFVKALLNSDTMAIKALLPDEVQNAITAAQWTEIASEDASAVVVFAPAIWSGDAKAVVTLTAPDTTGTLTFTIASADATSVAMAADIAGSTEMDTIELVAAGANWRVVSISNGTDTTLFDVALVQSMVASPTPDPSTAP
jgi:hypothetical protein